MLALYAALRSSRIVNGTVHGFQKNQPWISLKSDLQLVILEATEFWLEKIWEFRTELLASLTKHFIGLAFLQDGMNIVLADVSSGL